RDSEVYKLKTWSSFNAEGRTVEWPMVSSTVEMGFFNHDVVAKPEIEGVEVRCRFTANEQTENLKSQFSHGTEFTCAGRVGSIFPSSDKTVITISDARAIKAAGAAQPTPKYVSMEPTLRTSKVPIDHARKALEAFKSACTPLFTR